MTDFDLDAFIPYRLAVASARVSRAFSTLYRQKFGLSVAEWRVLAHLSQSDAVSVREIHRRADLEKSKVSRAASRLEERGLVRKETDDKDKRLVALTLTPRGRALMAELIPLAQDFQRELLDALGDGAEAFAGALDRLCKTDANQA